MVLKAPHYGFIGLKLKGLIFHESNSRRARGVVNTDGWKEPIVKENTSAGGSLTMNKEDEQGPGAGEKICSVTGA